MVSSVHETNRAVLHGQIFKEEIERTDQPGGPILDSQDVKAIFGGIPSIYDVHIKIRDELNEMISNWSDGESVGNIFLRHVSVSVVCGVIVLHNLECQYISALSTPQFDG